MRIQGDKYYTPVPIYDWLAGKLQLEDKVIFDPCCGMRHPTLQAFKGNNKIVENDSDLDVLSNYHFDSSIGLNWYECKDLKSIGWSDWVITNPPYNKDLLPILNNALNFSSEGVAMLLRLTFLEPSKNRREVLTDELWGKSLKAVYPVNPRPQFDPSKKGTDNVTVAWFIWATDDVRLEPFNFCIDWRN